MPPSTGIPSAYAGGYSEAVRKELQGVELPEKIKCKICKKFRMQSAFSKRQLAILINAVVVQGRTRAINGPGHAKCSHCSGQQVSELRCCICDQSKSLDEFAKNQRHEHDSARCINCVQHHADAEPVLEENKLLTETDMSTTHGSIMAGSQMDNVSLQHSTAKLNLSNASRYPYADEEDDDDHSVGGCWIETDRSDENTRGRLTTSRPEIASSVHSGWASWGINVEPARAANFSKQSVAGMVKKRDSKFAKVPGKRFENTELSVMKAPEPPRHTVPSDDEDDEAGIEDFL